MIIKGVQNTQSEYKHKNRNIKNHGITVHIQITRNLNLNIKETNLPAIRNYATILHFSIRFITDEYKRLEEYK